MPLAGHRGGVAGGLQHAGDRGRSVWQRWGVASSKCRATKAAGIAAGHQGHTRGRALRHHIVLSEHDAFCGKLIKVWAVHPRVVVADVCPALVVADDDDDIGPLVGSGCENGSRVKKQTRRNDHQRTKRHSTPTDTGAAGVGTRTPPREEPKTPATIPDAENGRRVSRADVVTGRRDVGLGSAVRRRS